MSMQRAPKNSIEQRKKAVRIHSRNALVFAGAGLVGGAVFALIASTWLFLGLGVIIGVLGGAWQWSKVQKIINEGSN